ncbi:siderophore ABC transporter substrate-binding protein [Alkalihalobacillus sp. LMS6]|uniref:siderophore ABC transporter substrate-binding protein n=1 Tax=Alkalihalobacillus sp. LMS6 TaxID=2924034 RepID=UPI0020D01EAF|nr:siderophore ABC transporter substrate-binding protein [Alkalihalobacillus sp. LMS6]UTR05387.1 siderophore ABC transporter substrate-binding protein [Alkalihalobacillus sp. LMS6]
MKTSSKWFMTAGAALFLAACGNGDSEENSNDASSGEGSDTEEQQTVEVETMNGDMVEVPLNPEKVVSFDHGVTDSIRAIGGDISGIPMGSNVPEYLQELENDDSVENVGSLFEPDFELIYEMEPDVIFISGRASENYEELSEIAPTVFLQVDNQNFMETFESNMNVLGEIFDASEEVDSQLADINSVIEDVQARADESEANALIVSIDEGSASAYGIGSRFGIVHDVLGIPAADEDIPAEGHGQNISNEYFSVTDPDYIFAIDRGASIGNSATADDVLANEEVQRTPAYENDNIYQLNSEVWYLSGSGLESVKIIVDEINEAYEQ